MKNKLDSFVKDTSKDDDIDERYSESRSDNDFDMQKSLESGNEKLLEIQKLKETLMNDVNFENAY